MKDLVSQDYIDYQDGTDHYKYYGQPVDALDRACHNHRECLRCARLELDCASDGISEHYLNFDINSLGYCKDSVGTCERSYCECARQYIEVSPPPTRGSGALTSVQDIHDNGIFRYSPKLYSRKYGFEANEETCQRAVDKKGASIDQRLAERNGRRPIGCCSTKMKNQSPWRLYNTDKFQCCTDGQIRTTCWAGKPRDPAFFSSLTLILTPFSTSLTILD